MTRSMNRWIRRGALALAVAGIPMLAAATPVAGRFHLALSRAEPAVNDTVTASPTALKLWFTETVQASATSVRVTGPDEHVVKLGDVTVAAAAKSPAVAKIAEALKPGTYTVAWRAMADDGHPSNGKFVFTVRTAH